jgi:hypothetical protein
MNYHKNSNAHTKPKKKEVKQMRCEIERVFWYRDGKVEINTELGELLAKELMGKEPIYEFKGMAQEAGMFEYKVYGVDGIDGLVIKAKWQPFIGYSWSEEYISIIRFEE